MRVFAFTGDPNHGGDGPMIMRVFGITFPKGTMVAVEDPAIAAKLSGSNHFTEGDEADLPCPPTDEDGVDSQPAPLPNLKAMTKAQLMVFAAERCGFDLDEDLRHADMVALIAAKAGGHGDVS